MSNVTRPKLTGIEWPSREEWARQRRTLDGSPEVGVDVDDYMTEEELLLLLDAMRERWKEIGKEMRAATDHDEREDCKERRAAINRGIKELKAGYLPEPLWFHRGAEDLLRPYIERRTVARIEATKAAEEEAARRPIDDAAWAKELERRRRLTS